MESTGVYWKPVWPALEGSFDLILANPFQVKNIPGRTTDARDSQWLAELLAHGLIRPSFAPPRETRDHLYGVEVVVRQKGVVLALYNLKRHRIRNRWVDWEKAGSMCIRKFFVLLFVCLGLVVRNSAAFGPQASSDPQDIAWTAVQHANVVAGYEVFLKEYPDGKYAPVARVKLALLQADGKPDTKLAARPVKSVQGVPLNSVTDWGVTDSDLSIRTGTAILNKAVLTHTVAEISAAAEAGDRIAQYLLGIAYESGRGVAKDPAKCVQWLTESAKQSVMRAAAALGVKRITGDGTEEDMISGWGLLLTAAREGGNAHAQYWAAFLTLVGVDQGNGQSRVYSFLDLPVARDYLVSSAEAGHPLAEYLLGESYAVGDARVNGAKLIAKNKTKAVYWLSRAAEHERLENDPSGAALKLLKSVSPADAAGFSSRAPTSSAPESSGVAQWPAMPPTSQSFTFDAVGRPNLRFTSKPRDSKTETVYDLLWTDLTASEAYKSSPIEVSGRNVTVRKTVVMKSATAPASTFRDSTRVQAMGHGIFAVQHRFEGDLFPGGSLFTDYQFWSSLHLGHADDPKTAAGTLVASQMPVQSFFVSKIESISGSLAPFRIGATQSVRYLSVGKPASSVCSITDKVAAATLNPQLTGDAWKLACTNVFDQDSSNVTDYLLDELDGMPLSLITTYYSKTGIALLPESGKSVETMKVTESPFTTTYTIADWQVN